MRNNRHASNYVRLQRSREARLWITTIITTIAVIVSYLDNHPETKQKLEEKVDDILNLYRKCPQIRYIPPTNNK